MTPQEHIKVAIIDDEQAALDVTAINFKRHYPLIKNINCFDHPELALIYLRRNQIDLLILDIEMPQLTGFQFLEKLENSSQYQIIFSTAYDQYAIKAFEYAAVGYLLKPYTEEDFKSAVDRAIQNIGSNHQNALDTRKAISVILNSDLSKINIPTQEGWHIVNLEDIVRIESINRYAVIILESDRKIISSYNLGKFRGLLDQDHFVLTHKSHIVNKSYVSTILNNGNVRLKDGTEVPYSKAKKQSILNKLL